MKKLIPVFTLAGLAILSGWFYLISNENLVSQQTTPTTAGASSKDIVIGSRRPDFELPGNNDTSHHIKEWDGKTVLVNFWASWCPPCREEMPGFIELKDKYSNAGFEIIGIALDTPENANNFATTIGVNYPILFADMTNDDLSIKFGNWVGGLPYSALIDKEGIIRFVQAGELKKSRLEKELKKLL